MHSCLNDPQNVPLSESSITQKSTYCMFPFIINSSRGTSNLCWKKSSDSLLWGGMGMEQTGAQGDVRGRR